jgi:lipopolysaccharide export system permease protein
MLFDSTVRKELARGFGATLVVILTIVLTNVLIRSVGQAASGAVAPQDVVLLLGYVTLGYLPTLIALSLFVAVVLALGRMYRDSEMAIWFASGVGITRFVRPVLQTSAPVLLVVAALVLLVWPWGNRASLELRERYQQRGDLSRVTPGVFQASSDGRRVFFVERGASAAAGPGEARNVFILTRSEQVESVVSARAGRIDSDGGERFLVLERGQRNSVDLTSSERTLASFERYRIMADEQSVRAAESRAPRTVSTAELLAAPTPRAQGELAWRIGLVLGAANLLVLGIGLAATQPRRASNWNLLFALLAFVVYYNLISLSQAWVASGRLPLGAALGLLHGGVFAAALVLLWWRDHGTVRAAPPWRGRRRKSAA